jgi:dipeptidyl aminopeptidase/acylaminoacyl peptidase
MIFQKQIEKMYRSNLFVRNDNPNGIFYFGPDDFPGLQAHPYEFTAKAGHTLKGYFYHYEDPVPGRLIVFDHGMGNGHRAYMREIERLAREGFLVFSYDHTGCMESGGESTNGFGQSLSDLDDCISAIKQIDQLKRRRIAVMGHSWGGYSTLNIAAYHPEISHVISMSGFVSIPIMIQQTFSGPLKCFQETVLALEEKANPEYVFRDARRSIWFSETNYLLIYSANDPVVRKNPHYDMLHNAFSRRYNVKLLLVEGKGHSPNYTKEAVNLKDAFFKDFQKAVKRKKLETPEQQKAFMSRYDWKAMTEQDEYVWKEVFATLMEK